VRRLEKQGLNGRLVLIDGAPEQLKAILEQFIPSTTEEELQNNVLLAIMDTVQSILSEKVDFIRSIAKILFDYIFLLLIFRLLSFIVTYRS